MCLNHAFHSSEFVSDEVVPSRYAIRVGEVDVRIISDGVLPISTAVLAANVEESDRENWLDEQFLPRDVFGWPLNAAVVRSGGRTILVDAGLGSEFPGFPQAGQLSRRLAAAGIDPGSLTDVVLTHIHMDHVGGLLGDELRSQLRPDLRVHLAGAEAEFWESPDFSGTSMPSAIPDVLRSAARRFLDTYRGELCLFEKEYEVAPGVVVRRTGGHTPGHSVVHVASGGDRLAFVGDALFPVNFDHPEWHNGFDHEPEDAIRVRFRLLEELAESRALVVASHLTFPSAGRVAVDGGAFRCVPALWAY